jgi:hypothetical protein
MAQNPLDYSGNDSLYTTDGCLLLSGSHRVFVEGSHGLRQRERRRPGCTH